MNPYETFSELNFSLVNAPPEQVAAVVLKAYNRPTASSRRDENDQAIPEFYLSQELTLSFPYVDVPAVSAPYKMVLWEPKNCPNMCACMCATTGGPVELAKESAFRWIGCVIADRSLSPGCTFDDVEGDTRRGLAAIKEEKGWVFHSWGPVRTYEVIGNYTRRLIRDRLNRQVITDYMRRLGADISDAQFWQTESPVLVMRKKAFPAMSREQWAIHYASGIKRQYEEEDRLYKEMQRQAADGVRPSSEEVPIQEPMSKAPPLAVASLEDFFRGGSEEIACNLAEKHPGNATFFSILKAIRSRPDVQQVFVALTDGDFLDPDAKFSSDRVYVVTEMSADKLREIVRPLFPDDVAKTPLAYVPGTTEPLRKGHAVFSVWWD